MLGDAGIGSRTQLAGFTVDADLAGDGPQSWRTLSRITERK